MFSIFDILAAVFLMLAMMRRLEVKALQSEDYPRVDPEVLKDWRERATRMYGLIALVCVTKVLLSQLFIAVALPWVSRAVTVVTGLLIDGAWVVLMVVAWRRTTEARAERVRLGLWPPAQRSG